MTAVRASGLIIFRRLPCIQYLLMQTSYGIHHWTPPKGHVDPGETDMQAALRETQEEAGLVPSDFEIIEGFKKELKYEVGGRLKIVTYWLAELIKPSTQVTMSAEHQDYRWLEIEDACTLAKFNDMQELLRECHSFLNGK